MESELGERTHIESDTHMVRIMTFVYITLLNYWLSYHGRSPVLENDFARHLPGRGSSGKPSLYLLYVSCLVNVQQVH